MEAKQRISDNFYGRERRQHQAKSNFAFRVITQKVNKWKENPSEEETAEVWPSNFV